MISNVLIFNHIGQVGYGKNKNVRFFSGNLSRGHSCDWACLVEVMLEPMLEHQVLKVVLGLFILILCCYVFSQDRF